MTDETKSTDTPDTPTPDEANQGSTTAVEDTPEGATPDPDEGKLHQDVEVSDAGPCKKHLRVAIGRKDIENRIKEKLSEMVGDANVAGFRPGKAPRKIVEKRYYKDVSEQVKNEMLLVSLQQLAEDHDIAPLNPPNIDPYKIILPEEGPLVYEFSVEVRPEFDLPDYKGLKLKKPIHTFTPEEHAEEKRRILMPFGQIAPKTEGDTTEVGDVISADVVVRNQQEVIQEIKEGSFRVEKQLAFKDAVAPKFGEEISGAKIGDKRTIDIEVSQLSANPALRGKTLQAEFDIKDVKTIRLPELTHEFLHNFGAHSEEQFDEMIEVLLNRRLEYTQRRSMREQITQQIAATASWELPEDLLRRQSRKAMARRVQEMRSEGLSEEEIASRQRVLERDIVQHTEVSLKEHFILQKIAEVENIEVEDADIDTEIERLAEQNDESPRRLRARLEREDMLDVVAADIIERRVLDLIMESAEHEEVPFDDDDEDGMATAMSDEQAVPGEMQDPDQLAEQEEESASEEAASEEAK